MKETLTERMMHAAEHCEGMYDLLDEAKALREGANEIDRLRAALRKVGRLVNTKGTEMEKKEIALLELAYTAEVEAALSKSGLACLIARQRRRRLLRHTLPG